MNIVIKITPNEKGNPPDKLADAELHFIDSELDGFKLIGDGEIEGSSSSVESVSGGVKS